MAFWNSEKLRACGPCIITVFNSERVQQAAYELSVGGEYYVTSMKGGRKVLGLGDQIEIPPGQLALLITEERLKVPANVIGFISMKFGPKKRGLINVSGFHVDPGFQGRLKFSVYNAGSTKFFFDPGQALFLIWFSDLSSDEPHKYNGEHQNQLSITATDVTEFQGEVASPAQLKREIDKLSTRVSAMIWLFALIVISIAGAIATQVFGGEETSSGSPVRSEASAPVPTEPNQ